jgi:diacylglycerol O-acyltransferase
MATRLSAPEALAVHTQTAKTPADSLSVIVLEASRHLNHDTLGRWIASALSQSAQFRSRLVEKPFGVGQPVWAEIPDFDPDRRIRHVTVPGPGGERELEALVLRLSEATTFSRALWHAWTIDGLPGGRWAVAVKLSTVLADGGAGVAAMWRIVLTSRPITDRTEVREYGLGSTPSPGELMVDTLVELVENQVAGAYLASDVAVHTLAALRKPNQVRDEPTGFGGSTPQTRRRSMAFVSIPTVDLRAVSLAFGGDAVNVLLAACAVSMQGWMQRHDAVRAEFLSLAVPAGQVRVAVRLDDPVHVLTTMHTVTERLRMATGDCEEGSASVDLAAAVALFPPRLARLAARAFTGLGLARRSAPRCHASVSSFSGPRGSAFCAGSEVVGMYNAAPMTEGCGVNISVTLRGEVIDVCVSGCPDDSPGIGDIADGIAEAVEVLIDAAADSPRGEGQSVVTEMASHNSRSSRA